MASQPTIRPACAQEAPLILELLRAAAQEQAPGTQITATEDSLARTLHFDPPAGSPAERFAWPLLIFAPDDRLAGLLIYYKNYSTWTASPGLRLEELYVVPEFRRYGYARLLLQKLASIAEATGCTKMDWVCLADNQKALNFYHKIGAKTMQDWVVLTIDQVGIEKLTEERKP